jgi:BirA family transcriptional regulator, biotin operon repressor / biotin---[acetyl-CoA-carboxylase] ligase
VTPSLPQGVRLVAFETLDSTSDEAGRRIRANEVPVDAILVLLARRQTAGRGRLGRRWDSRVGNLHMTLVLPSPAPERIGELAFVAAVAAGEAVAAPLPAGRLAYKWPNDLMCGARKLGGILVETETAPSGARFAAIGIGINVARAPDDLPATSLAAEGAATTADDLAAAVAAAVVRWHARWQSQGFAPVRANWLAAAQGLGRPMIARTEGGETRGVFAGIDGTGRLVLERDGAARHIAAAEIVAA